MQETTPRKTPHFLRNRDEWIRMVNLSPDVSHVAARVAVNLAMRMNIRTRDAWPSIDTIAKDIGASPRSVISAIDQLVEEGFLGAERKRNKGNVYWLVFKWQ